MPGGLLDNDIGSRESAVKSMALSKRKADRSSSASPDKHRFELSLFFQALMLHGYSLSVSHKSSVLSAAPGPGSEAESESFSDRMFPLPGRGRTLFREQHRRNPRGLPATATAGRPTAYAAYEGSLPPFSVNHFKRKDFMPKLRQVADRRVR